MEPDTNTKNEIRQITASNNKDNTHTIEGDDHQPLKTRSRKGIAKTFNRKTIEAIFPAKYIENGLNGTKAYQSIRPHSPSDSAKVEASRILTKPNVQQALQELLSENKLTVNETMKIHRRNLIQKDNLSVSQTAVQDVYKIAGLMNNKQSETTINIALITKE